MQSFSYCNGFGQAFNDVNVKEVKTQSMEQAYLLSRMHLKSHLMIYRLVFPYWDPRLRLRSPVALGLSNFPLESKFENVM